MLRRVGKTELCKALASYMFDTEEALVRTRCLRRGEYQLVPVFLRDIYIFDHVEAPRVSHAAPGNFRDVIVASGNKSSIVFFYNYFYGLSKYFKQGFFFLIDC